MSKYCSNEPSSPVHKVWKPELYKIQLEAPTPKPVYRDFEIPNGPDFYGREYYGILDHKESEKLLCNRADGSYLIRQSPGAIDFFTLSLRFDNRTKHYKIYYKSNWGHYLKEDFKRFDTIDDLTADGLVNFYMQKNASSIIADMMTQTKTNYQQSPYMTLNRRKLRALSNDLRKNIHTVTDNFISGEKNHLIDISSNDTAINNTNHINNNNNNSTDDADILPIVYEKMHAFKIHNFKGLNWCELCANFLWGFTAQGVKCEDCGFMAHHKCSELVPAKCVPDLKRIRGVFGTDLTTLVTAHQCVIPFVIKRCVEEVESRGMFQEGIYRVSGFADEIDALKLALDKEGEKTDMSETAYSNVNVIAGILKLFLRLLPIPLITFQAYPSFIASTQCKSVGEQVISIRESMKYLPQAHYNCLKYIIEHLTRVASHHAINKMTEHNLATVFAPTLIAIPQHLTDLSQEIFMLTSLITNCHAVYL